QRWHVSYQSRLKGLLQNICGKIMPTTGRSPCVMIQAPRQVSIFLKSPQNFKNGARNIIRIGRAAKLIDDYANLWPLRSQTQHRPGKIVSLQTKYPTGTKDQVL